MRCATLLSILVILPVIAQAQQSLTSLEIAGRFAELEQAAEARVASRLESSTSSLAPLCVAYSKLKRYAKLFPCLVGIEKGVAAGDVEIETDRPFVSNSDATALAATLRAQAHLELGEYSLAITDAKTALGQIQDRRSAGLWPPTKYRLLNLGVIPLAHAMAGNRETALMKLKELENFSYPFVGNAAWRPMKAYAIARIHMALDDYVAALPFVEKDDWFPWINDPTWGLKSDDSADIHLQLPKLVMRGTCQLETGNTAAAQHALELALRHPRIAEFGELYWIALYQAGRVAELQRKLEQAIELYRRAVNLIEMQRASINTEASKIGFVGNKQAVYARLITVLVEQGSVAEAFDYVERSKSRALVDMLASKKDFAAQDPAQARLVLAQLDAADLGARAQDESAKPGAQPAGSRNLQVAREALQSAAPELSTLVTVTSVPSAELSSLVGVDETLVEYYYNGSDMIAFTLSRDGFSVTKLDGIGLDSQVQALRAAIEQPSTTAWQAPSQALYEKLWKPIESSISTKNVIIVAHGALHYLPFSVLQVTDGTLLIDRIGMRYLPSASVLKFLRPSSTKKDSQLLALGNPDLGDAKLDLKFAEGEARLIAGMSKTSRLLVRLDASETNFKKTASVFSRLHFATHGKFQADDPLSSGLYLTKDAENDGVLTVGELYSMNLDADLVTLSACETGLGKVANGDDVVGLTRGFLYAGSRSIVASLWSVDDQATATLMKSFYENLSSQTKREALRLAQLKTREAFPHPFYWAAFQLTGRAD